ncbi:MAG: alpha-mannosidase [Clostridia bacterium]|nr:alpha-mannosidase [Clostridia bacterium]
MDFKKCIKSFVNLLEEARNRKLFPLEGIEYCQSGYKKGNCPPADGWIPFEDGTMLSGNDVHFWLRTKFRTPAIASRERMMLRIATGREGTWDATNTQGIVYLNGYMAGGLDTNHTEIDLCPDTDYALHLYLYMGSTDSVIHPTMTVWAVDTDTEGLYYDVKVPFDAYLTFSETSEEYIRTMSLLSDVANMTDTRAVGSPSYRESVLAAREYMEKEFYGKRCTPDGKPVIHCVASTHIDVEWRWDRFVTREKIQHSFATAKALMDRYPEYRFMLSQPELYRYLKEEAPEKYEELLSLIREGRWEPEGAMYVEADCNLTTGESLVRQILYGKRFFREELGCESRVLYLPDVFGYSAALPQILKKSGVDYFVTSKISWNDTNMMPKDAFLWEGIDGSEIPTFFITDQAFGGTRRSDGSIHKNYTTYNGRLNASEIRGTWDRFQQKEYCNRALSTYGFGDGGGGPTAEMLENYRRLSRGLPGMPVAKITTLTDYLDTAYGELTENSRRTGRTPKWVGELYLEYHRGTYTSVSKVKEGNRRAEQLLATAEALSVTDLAFGGSYDKERLDRAWRKVLHNQFHDILPGSSIESVYELTDKDYAEIFDYGNRVVADKLSSLSEKIASNGGVLVYNPIGWARKGAFRTEEGYVECAEEIPAFGWRVLSPKAPVSSVTVKGLVAENRFYTLALNEAGQIASLYDKRADREVLKAGKRGNVLTVFEDHPIKYDAWEIEEYYRYKRFELNEPAEITPITDGSRGGFRICRKYMDSVISQNLWLYSESSRIDFETDLDWHETHQILKAIFPLDVHATAATYDVQFGHVVRPTHENTSWDEARFECYAHKWMDLSEKGYGVSLLSANKYGYGVLGSTVGVTLLKCPTDPNPHADQGAHHFVYSLMPHVGDFREAGVIAEAWALNQPQITRTVSAHIGSLPAELSLVSCDAPNMVVTAVKRTEEDDALLVRMYDAFDCRSNVTLTVPATYAKAYLCDLMESPVKELNVVDGKVIIPVSNFEIVTVKFSK